MKLTEILSVFFRVGIVSFGGSPVAWMHREIVERRRWMDDDGFLAGYTFSQVLPGANAVNLSLYVGLHARGAVGATVAAIGMVGPSFALILMFGALYSRFGHAPMAHALLAGFAATGIGMTLSIGYKLARRMVSDLVLVIIAAMIFGAIGILHWPMVPVVLVLTPLSIAIAFYRVRNH